jgi:hypothetical protein
MTRSAWVPPLLGLVLGSPPGPAGAGEMPWVAVAKDRKGFVHLRTKMQKQQV